MSRLVILGSANADHVMSFEYLPAPGQTLMSKDYRLEHGGKGANQAVACARLRQPGNRVDFICHLGADGIAEQMSQSWCEDGIHPEGITKVDGQSTGTAMIFVGADGENSIGVSLGANASLTTQALAQHQMLLVDADWLLVQLETPTTTVAQALKSAKKHGANTLLNPAPATVLGTEIYKWVDIITPNETEAETITGIEVTDEKTAKLAAQMLHQLGPETVIITLGSQGAYLSCQEFEGIVAGVDVKPIDTVGAGDTFNGALMVALSESMTIRDAVVFANRAAAIAVTRPGAQRSIPYRHEL